MSLTEGFRIVSDETRLRIIVLLAQKKLYVCQICGILNLSQPKVSKNLSKLRDMKYVADERKEKYILYELSLTDSVMKNLILDIVTHLDEYPQLREDSRRMAAADVYLKQCKNKCPDVKKEQGR